MWFCFDKPISCFLSVIVGRGEGAWEGWGGCMVHVV